MNERAKKIFEEIAELEEAQESKLNKDVLSKDLNEIVHFMIFTKCSPSVKIDKDSKKTYSGFDIYFQNESDCKYSCLILLDVRAKKDIPQTQVKDKEGNRFDVTLDDQTLNIITEKLISFSEQNNILLENRLVINIMF